MRKYLFILILFFIPAVNATVLLEDDWDDLDFTNNLTWGEEMWWNDNSGSVTASAGYLNFSGSRNLQVPTGITSGDQGVFNLSIDRKFDSGTGSMNFMFCDDGCTNYMEIDFYGTQSSGSTDICVYASDIISDCLADNVSLDYTHDGSYHNYLLSYDTTLDTFGYYIDGTKYLEVTDSSLKNLSYVNLQADIAKYDNFQLEYIASATPTPTPTVTSLNYTAPTAFEECECLWNDLYIWILGTVIMFALCVFDRR